MELGTTISYSLGIVSGTGIGGGIISGIIGGLIGRLFSSEILKLNSDKMNLHKIENSFDGINLKISLKIKEILFKIKMKIIYKKPKKF